MQTDPALQPCAFSSVLLMLDFRYLELKIIHLCCLSPEVGVNLLTVTENNYRYYFRRKNEVMLKDIRGMETRLEASAIIRGNSYIHDV